MGQFKSKKTTKVNSRSLHVSVDVSLYYHYAYCFTLSGEEQKPFRFSNNGKGFHYFYKRLQKLRKEWSCEDIIVGLESTGSYGDPLIHYLSTRSVTLVQVNPFHTKRVKELTDNSPGKSDPKDTKVIASLMKLGHILKVVVPRGAAAELRRLVHERERLLHDRTALYNRLHALVFVLFPEFILIMKNIKSKSARYVLSTVPTPGKMLKRGYTWLQRSLHRVSRGKLTATRAHELYEGARTSAGVKEGEEGLLHSITHILEQLELIENQVNETESCISHHLATIPTSCYIMSIKGIGEITAAAIIGEIGDFSLFKHAKELEKLAGYNLYYCSSGKYQGQRRISKRGRALLRKVLYFASLNLVRKGGVFHGEYQAFLARGKKKPVALTNIAKKTLRLIFALAREKRKYEENYNLQTKGLPKAA